MNGMRGCLNEFYITAQSSAYNIFILTETWLNENHLNTEIFNDEWNISRLDRPGDTVGGGVMIAVHNSLCSNGIKIERTTTYAFDAQQTFIKIALRDKNVYIGAVYIRPQSNINCYEENFNIINDVLASTNENDDIFIVGDFNLHGLEWVESDLNQNIFDAGNITNEIQCATIDFFAEKGLHQLCPLKNHAGNVLDLVFTNVVDNCNLGEVNPILPSKTHLAHKTFCINYFFSSFTGNCNVKVSEMCYDFKNADYNLINDALIRVDWNLTPNDDVNASVESFMSKVWNVIDEYVPRRVKTIDSGPPWSNPLCRSLKNRKNRAYKKWCVSGLERDYELFVSLANSFVDADVSAYLAYVQRTGSELKSDPRKFYRFVNYKREISGFPKSMSLDDHCSADDTEVCEMFAKFFESVYADPFIFQPSHFDYLQPDPVEISDLAISMNELLDGLYSLDKNKGAGPDGIPPVFLRNTAERIAKPLLTIFNDSLASGVFPTKWKASFISSIFKAGDRTDVRNYRAVAILSAIPKLFEKIICDKLSIRLRHFIDLNQHGFMKKRSTTTNLSDYASYLLKNLENGFQIDAAYTDFSKAFDKVDHKLLLFKLSRYGVRGKLLDWIGSYLQGRVQFVRFRGITSRPITVTSGVSQGSHIGPLLFNLFVNDLPRRLTKCRYFLYADDLKMCVKFKKDEGDSTILQRNLTALNEWCVFNNLLLNVSKCNVMSFFRTRNGELHDYSIDGTLLNRVKAVNDLGVIFDRTVSFRDHCLKVCNNGMRVLNFVKRRAHEFLDPYVTKSLYCSFVRSILEYCSVVWNPREAQMTKKIESVQKQFLRFALRHLGWDRSTFELPPYENRLKLLGMETLEKRRHCADALFAFDLLKGNIDCVSLQRMIRVNSNPRHLRHVRYLEEDQHRTSYGQNGPVSRASRTFNSNFRHFDDAISRDSFKKLIKNG